MRIIDADELMEHVYRDRLDSRELIAEMIRKAPTVETDAVLRREFRELEARAMMLEEQAEYLKGQIKALVFAVRVNGVSGGEVAYEREYEKRG